MNIVKTWSILNLTARPTLDGQEQVISMVTWKLVVSDDLNHEVVHTGVTTLGLPDSESFLNFSELTEQQVLGWVKGVIGQKQIDQLESNMIASLLDQVAPTEFLHLEELPWMRKA